jgi:phage recombination protein Bet
MNEEKKEIQTQDFTRDQIELIKATVAKGATDNELKLFLHNCKRLGLDPFAKQVHFVKYGNAPGTIIVGVDGFRVIAARTGAHSGTKRGALYDESGRLVGAWCEVYRSDWSHPAREEVPFVEYNNPNNPSWRKMPETMIKKVAECAALRMAFPAELSGVYGQEEMDQAKESERTPVDEKEIPHVSSVETLKEVNRASAGIGRVGSNHLGTISGVVSIEPPVDFNQAPAGGSIHSPDEKPGVKELDRLNQHVTAHRWPKGDVTEYMKLRFGKTRLSELNMSQYNDLMKTVGTHTSVDALRNWREGKFL